MMKEIKQNIWIQNTIIPDPVGYVSFGWIKIHFKKSGSGSDKQKKS